MYKAIYNKATPAASMAYLENSYNSKLAGCIGIAQALLNTDPLRPAATDYSAAKNKTYIAHLYQVAFRRAPMAGDNPTGIENMRKGGATLEQVENIFLFHPEFAAICTNSGLKTQF